MSIVKSSLKSTMTDDDNSLIDIFSISRASVDDMQVEWYDLQRRSQLSSLQSKDSMHIGCSQSNGLVPTRLNSWSPPPSSKPNSKTLGSPVPEAIQLGSSILIPNSESGIVSERPSSSQDRS